MSSPSATNQPPSLTSLPPELITAIVSHLPRDNSISLALTARAFFAPSERRICKELVLVLPTHFGEHPLVQPIARRELGYWQWTQQEEARVTTRQRDGLREKVRRVAMYAGERRLGMVQELRIDPRPGSLYGLVHLLDAVSPTLKRLELERYRRSFYISGDSLDFHETIENKFIDAALHIPALTHVKLGDFTLQYSDFVLLLCGSAPNLAVLEAGCQDYLPSDDLTPYFPLELPGETMLEILELTFVTPELRDDPEFIEDLTAPPLLIVLGSSPALRKLSLQYGGESYSVLCPISRILSEHQNLTDLHWSIKADRLSDLCFEDKPTSNARRLAIHLSHWADVFCPPKGFPKIEIFCLIRSPYARRTVPAIPSQFPPSSSVYPMIPSFADGLRHSSSLSTIHTLISPFDDNNLDVFDRLDEVEKQGTATGRIWSYCHAGKELLRATLLLSHIEVFDEATDMYSDGYEYDRPEVFYTARGGKRHKKTFVQLPEPTWLHFTDIDDLVVPLAVIEKMRVVQGATEAEWQKRGVEVGDAAWAVLIDCREEQEEAERQGEMEKTKGKEKTKKNAKKAN